ncbi:MULTISPECIES: SGNH/GDSL hydrolase family protein [Bacillus]|uniref:SGNH/GDSL hydrolase family protein n=1 Tax=Bacillus TaxID=1386 RepID=UPI000C767A63|nr:MULTISPECIES: SGNH/GDSL hydrolase family protein [Bacillus]PLR82758.1 GDSL family lipase [Bacillus sp. V33-4]RSK45432.1 GDSL family lipase [Bacillus canaveralius]
MKKTFISLLLCTILLSSCDFISSETEMAHPQKQLGLVVKQDIPDNYIPREISVVSVGDSLTEGVGDSTERGGYIPYLREKLEADKGIKGADFQNYGVKGNRTTDLIRRLEDPEVRAAIEQADITVITIGGNDMMKVVRENISHLKLDDFAYEKERYEERLQEILNTVKSYNKDTAIVLVGLYNPFVKWFSNIDELNMIVSEWNLISQSTVTQYENAYFVEIMDIFENPEEDILFTDYFHPNDRGYELIGERVYKELSDGALAENSGGSYISQKEETQNR